MRTPLTSLRLRAEFVSDKDTQRKMIETIDELQSMTEAAISFARGESIKEETRAIARELGLMVADKHDSQDICFVPQGRYTDVVEKLSPNAAEPGDIVHVDGRVLGRHKGVIHYTIGQRRGLGVGGRAEDAEPLYVVRLEPARRVQLSPEPAGPAGPVGDAGGNDDVEFARPQTPMQVGHVRFAEYDLDARGLAAQLVDGSTEHVGTHQR